MCDCQCHCESQCQCDEMAEDSEEDIWDYKSLKRTRKQNATSSSTSISSQIGKKTKTSSTIGRRPTARARGSATSTPSENTQRHSQRKFLSQQVTSNKSTQGSKAHQKRTHQKPNNQNLTKKIGGGTQSKFSSQILVHDVDSGSDSHDTDVFDELSFVRPSQTVHEPAARGAASSTSQRVTKATDTKRPLMRPEPSPSPCSTTTSGSSDLQDVLLLNDDREEVLSLVTSKRSSSPSQPATKPTRTKSKKKKLQNRKSKSPVVTAAATVSTPRKTYEGHCPNCQMPFSSPLLSSGGRIAHVYECMDKPFKAEEGRLD